MARKGINVNNFLSGSSTYPSRRVQLEQPRHNQVQSQNPPLLVQPRAGLRQTPSCSNLQDNEFDGDANIVTSSKKNTRGRTRMSHIWNLPEGEKIAITLNREGQPIKKNARSIADFLGTLARNGSLTPLNFNDWRYMPKAYKEDLWKIVTSKFDIPLRGENWVMKSLSKKWRDYKSELKGDFFEGKDPTEVYRNPPEEVIRSHWEYLVLYWCSAKGKELSQKNIRARGMQQFPHTSGSKPFAVVRDEMKESHPDKAEPTRTEVFMKTRKRKNGNVVDVRSEEAIEKLNTLASQRADTPKPR